MKSPFVVLALWLLLLTWRQHEVEVELRKELNRAHRNSAIAVLTAEALQKQVGAFSPGSGQDPETFAIGFIDCVNMPLAVFPDDVLIPIEQEIASKRVSSQHYIDDIMRRWERVAPD